MNRTWVFCLDVSRVLGLRFLPGLLLALLCLDPSLSFDLDPADKASLLLFRSSIQNPDRRLSAWSGSDRAYWTGVSCSVVGGRVVSLNLTDMNQSGDMGRGLCSLSSLDPLDLSWNRFSGSIPPCFGSLYNLTILNLGYNQFGRNLPDSWSRLDNLRELILTSNRELGGMLPSWIGNFSDRLEKLDLSLNSFEGAVPASLLQPNSLKHLTVLGFLNLADNAITGGIPSCIASLESLTPLNLSHNLLRYEVSPGLVISEKLFVLDLSFNELDGPLPSRIGKGAEKGLLLLDLSHNQFSGEIPPQITELKSLQVLLLSHNLLSGEIPARIGNLT
ncbi:hypothetical protein MLD38_039637 [Melastoma candidum]|uniref:Uncharacterized protein n=1 Tax=Melastoma candidum TaxID=119954 RepID=A0ACB9L327_9MYRT|nr:hypothetical protein MLD38_039637 [Melastoma candidum]